MMAVQTKYVPPSQSRGSRMKAWAGKNTITVPFDYDLGDDQQHIAAAVALITKMVHAGYWKAPHALASGTTSDGNGVHVMLMSPQIGRHTYGITMLDPF